MTTRPNHMLTDDELHARHLSLAASTQAGPGRYVDLITYSAACAEVDGVRAEVRRRALLGSSFCPDVPPLTEPEQPLIADDGPVRGLRAAAAVLNVGRGTLAMRIGAMPEHQQPARLGARGVVWWESADACRTWWADLHTVEPPAPRRRRKQRSRVTVGHQLPGSLNDALDAL